jgi:hypothetical protein
MTAVVVAAEIFALCHCKQQTQPLLADHLPSGVSDQFPICIGDATGAVPELGEVSVSE